ncbi:hypothetical protein [Micromonospora humidisoli]|uniref:Uncharacterized protein n=1 Tax=Micromonospora humidisoli TaxID=2807622 RepID=A0ABS2J5U7_9ACTN|nr:hypothetical protein [Micromonospora humidisoli]MBM7081936.1 hypothetical protein [Micromonospora humidisoli]
MTELPDHFPAHVKGSYVNCDQYDREARLTPPPDHIPAHVKNSYPTCQEAVRPPRLTLVPAAGA